MAREVHCPSASPVAGHASSASRRGGGSGAGNGSSSGNVNSNGGIGIGSVTGNGNGNGNGTPAPAPASTPAPAPEHTGISARELINHVATGVPVVTYCTAYIIYYQFITNVTNTYFCLYLFV